MLKARWDVERAFANFDPLMLSSFVAQRPITPSESQLQGTPTLSDRGQTASLNYSQTLSSGINMNGRFTRARSSTNSIYFFLNPYIDPGSQQTV